MITGVAAGNPQVKALVYVNAFAPDVGEKTSDLNKRYAAAPISTAIISDAANFLYIDRGKFHEFFAQDVSKAEARVMAATQKPIASAAFEQSVNEIAWKTIPSWFLVTQSDGAINPELQRFMAKRINAKTTEVNSSHVPFISHPKEVVKVIEAASTAVK